MRRGQAALEFLTTYGWAFLIIIVMVGAISYFGILNPSKFLPSRCTISPDFTCQDYRIAGNTLTIQLKQGIGKTIYFNSSGCSYSGTTPATYVAATNSISAGGSWSPSTTLTITCDFGTLLSGLQGQKVKLTYNLTYQKSANGLTHAVDGEVYDKIQ